MLLAKVTVLANVCLAVWNIQGEASNNEQVKIKRKSFEMRHYHHRLSVS